MKTIIIGGGIAGLTTALALQQRGINFELYERTPSFQPVGAGILLAKNAWAVYERLGLLDAVKDLGHPMQRAQITDARLKPISAIFQQAYLNLGIHRADLHQVLLDALPAERIHLGHTLKAFEQLPGKTIRCTFENGAVTQGDLLIGADGIHSTVRRLLKDDRPLRDAEQLCWRGTLDFDLPPPFNTLSTEAWGDRARFGFLEYQAGKVYWFAVLSEALCPQVNPMDKSEWTDFFQEFDPLIQKIIAATAESAIFFDRIADLPPSKRPWYQNNICLIGDAAHATTPNMGQGACQAIEDAYVLARCLSEPIEEVSDAFRAFQQLRQAKALSVVERSWQIGKIAHLPGPWLQGTRNAMMRLIPSSWTSRSMNKLLETNYL